MDVISLGFRTDLALLQLGGTEITERGDHLVIRTPHNPTCRWGNFLLLAAPPATGDAERWLDRFASEFPAAEHVAIGVDGTAVSAADVAGFVENDLRADVATVMTATSVRPPPRPNTQATYRMLTSDDDWAQSVELSMACNDANEDPVGHRTFVQRKRRTERSLTESGHGGWFGGFLAGRLATQMGLFAASPGLARFQWVETHPDVRGQGLAASLVHHVSGYGFETLGAKTLVMVADPEYVAIRVYRSVGFAAAESQTECERHTPWRGRP